MNKSASRKRTSSIVLTGIGPSSMMITENRLGNIEVNGDRDQGQILWSADELKKEEEVSMDTSLTEFGSKGKKRLCAQ